MFGGDGMFSWARDIGIFLGGLLTMATVGALSALSVAWSWWASRR